MLHDNAVVVAGWPQKVIHLKVTDETSETFASFYYFISEKKNSDLGW